MLKLYFGSVFSTISTLLIIAFGLFFGIAIGRRASVTNWGTMVLIMFFLGLFMSMMSGMKDGTGTASAVIPKNHWTMTVLCILGLLAFLAGIVSLFIRKRDFWQISFYTLSLIIIAKILITEAFRIFNYFKNVA